VRSRCATPNDGMKSNRDIPTRLLQPDFRSNPLLRITIDSVPALLHGIRMIAMLLEQKNLLHLPTGDDAIPVTIWIDHDETYRRRRRRNVTLEVEVALLVVEEPGRARLVHLQDNDPLLSIQFTQEALPLPLDLVTPTLTNVRGHPLAHGLAPDRDLEGTRDCRGRRRSKGGNRKEGGCHRLLGGYLLEMVAE